MGFQEVLKINIITCNTIKHFFFIKKDLRFWTVGLEPYVMYILFFTFG